MADYIEREAVMQKFADHVKRSNNSDFAPAPTWNQAVQIVEDFPAADVVPMDFHERCLQIEIQKRMALEKADVRPVVLCEDCKWYEIDELKKDGTEDRRYKPSVCMLAGQRREPNHFCADGKKREFDDGKD